MTLQALLNPFTRVAGFSVLFILLSFPMGMSQEFNDDIRNVAEKFVRQIVERDTDASLQYPVTDEFRAGMPNANTIIEWATEIDRLVGRLGDVVDAEIVEHPDLGLRSVFLYYQGTKRPAKIWVTFSGTTIAGFHYNVWIEGYAGRKTTRILESMSVAESIFWGCVLIPLFIMSLFLLNGKGAFLIVGYNTMSKKEQAKYDEKALCRFTGKGVLWITCCMMFVPFGTISGITWMSPCAEVIILVSAVVLVIYVKTGNRFLKKEVQEESFLDRTLYSRGVQGIIERFGTVVVLGGVVLAVAATPAIMFYGEQEPTVKITDKGIKISGLHGLKIDFTEITDISLIENGTSDIGLTLRTWGYAFPVTGTQRGYFQSNMYGSVRLFTNVKSSPTIHIKREGKADVFLNFSNEEATRIVYANLKTAFAR
jgi:hypothetical protein